MGCYITSWSQWVTVSIIVTAAEVFFSTVAADWKLGRTVITSCATVRVDPTGCVGGCAFSFCFVIEETLSGWFVPVGPGFTPRGVSKTEVSAVLPTTDRFSSLLRDAMGDTLALSYYVA